MKIAVIGPGSMGLLFAGKLSEFADVTLVGNDPAKLEEINTNGVTIRREEKSSSRRVPAVLSGTLKEPVDLVLLFTKAYQIREALENNRGLIGPETFLLTLQNGAGHDRVLREFADPAHVLIGTTKQGSYRVSASVIVNSGLGETVIGGVAAEGETAPSPDRLEELRGLFEKAGFPCEISENMHFDIWNKLMINASSSVLSGILQVPQGYIAEDPHAWAVCRELIREICRTAAGEGLSFDPEEQFDRLQKHLRAAADGYTSIYSDLKNGRKTEVDHICGAVLRAAEEQGQEVPVQRTILELVHAMEDRQ